MTDRRTDLLEPSPYPPVLSYGFRPMFFLAACQAALALPVFIVLWLGSDIPAISIAPVTWHAHEMLYGFVAAVVAGFLLTAVPNWTGMPPLRGWPLLALALLWLAARIAFWCYNLMPPLVVAAVDLVFLPALVLAIGPSILGARNRRNYVFFALLALLFLGNAAIHADLLPLNVPAGWQLGRRGQFLALDIFILMIGVVGGRIVPAFTGNFLRATALRERRTMSEITSHLLLDRLCILLLAAIVLADLVLGDRHLIPAVLCLLAAVAHCIRLGRWKGWSTRNEPILLVLHIGYLWLVLGLAVRGFDALFGIFIGAAGLHSLTVGAIGTMTMAVMARAALGHTGRPMKATLPLLIALTLVSVSALFRLLSAVPSFEKVYSELLFVSAAAWSLAFALFASILLPMVFRSRVDGLP